MMKRKLSYLLVCGVLAMSISCVSKNNYKIIGNVDKLEGWVYMWSSIDAKDSVFVNNGEFIFEGYAGESEFAQIYNNDKLFVFVIPDNNNIAITGTMDSVQQIKVENSPMTLKSKVTLEYLDKELKKIFAVEQNKRDSVFACFKKEISKAISENNNNIVGVLTLAENTFHLTPDETIENIGLLSKKMQLNNEIQKVKKRAEQQKLTSTGNKYIDFTLKDITKRDISLSSCVAKDKYILLDFWASWCGPCIGTVPQLKELYNKYHSNGFEILGVSLDAKKEAWVKAVQKYDMNWIHVSALKGWDCPVGQLYGVQSVPMAFLIDPNGVIIKKNVHIDELSIVLDSLFIKK